MRVCAAARAGLAARGGCIVNTGVDAELLRRRAGARLQRQQGRRRAADQVAGDRLRRRRHPRQRGRAGLDRDAADRRRCRTIRRAPARSSRARRWAAGARRTTSPAPVCSSPAPAARFVTGAVLPVDGGYLICLTGRVDSMIVQLPGIQPEIAVPAHSRRRARLGAAGARRLVPAAAAQHRHRRLVQPAARAQERRAVAAPPSECGRPAT